MAYSGWRIVGDDVYTCVPPPGYEIDPAVVRAIHEFDPGVIPIWRLQVWIRPNSEERETHVHSGIARHFPHPRYLRRPFRVTMPARAEHPVPNFLDAIFEDQTCAQYLFEGGPGHFIPWDWATYEWCRRKYAVLTAKKFDDLMEARRERHAKMRKDWQEEIEYRKKQIEPFLMKKASELSDADWDAYLGLMAHREAMRRRGLKPEPINQKKPFVNLSSGRSPRPLGETYGRVAPDQELSK
jgi:hypothetical protein